VEMITWQLGVTGVRESASLSRSYCLLLYSKEMAR